ncbi:hypothetical protein [Streptomyces sp. FH025]|uniref:hypothetical protein n=1 Tax=Streptomyces sp. FH025 TaxID=2815937 RepID=UPI001A9D3F7D|nr:hypothetical protein [Streptomyces sp. FH025]MBO1415086.1 hypothetical protein [Streptomyces sp. FH025]
MITEPLTVSIDGHLEPVTARALEALEALWQAVRALPIGEYQLGAMERLLGSGSTADLERLMNGDEATDFTLTLDGGCGHAVVRVRYGDGLTCRQRVAARYAPQQVHRASRGAPERWAVLDSWTDAEVVEDGVALRFGSESAAREWISGQVLLATYQAGPEARRAAE